MSLSASSILSMWNLVLSSPITSTPCHHDMFVVFLIRLSPIQPEIGSTGTPPPSPSAGLPMKSFFQPTLISMLRISPPTWGMGVGGERWEVGGWGGNEGARGERARGAKGGRRKGGRPSRTSS